MYPTPFCCLPARSPCAAFLSTPSSHGFACSPLSLGPHGSRTESHPRTNHRGLPVCRAAAEERPVCQHRAASSGRFTGSQRLYLSNQRCLRKAGEPFKFSVKECTAQRQGHAQRTRPLQPSSGGTRLPHVHPCANVTRAFFLPRTGKSGGEMAHGQVIGSPAEGRMEKGLLFAEKP